MSKEEDRRVQKVNIVANLCNRINLINKKLKINNHHNRCSSNNKIYHQVIN